MNNPKQPGYSASRWIHLNRQTWSQCYSYLDKSIVAHFEEREVGDKECEEFLQSNLKASTSRFLLSTNGKVLVTKPDPAPNTKICWLENKHIRSLNLDFSGMTEDDTIAREKVKSSIVLLGQAKSAENENMGNHFGVAIAGITEEEIKETIGLDASSASFLTPRQLLGLEDGSIANSELAVIGQAIARLNWHRNTKFSEHNAQPLHPTSLGHRLRTPGSDGKTTYPHINPVAICLVLNRDGSKCLLGERTNLRGTGIFTCFSGFLEQGESAEDASQREVREESGIELDFESIQIVGSQAWPLGPGGSCELMIGCIGVANHEDFQHNEEMSRVQWFSREEAQIMLDNSKFISAFRKKTKTYQEDPSKFITPPTYAIAHHLIRSWASDEAATSAASSKARLLSATAMGVLIGVVGSLAAFL